MASPGLAQEASDPAKAPPPIAATADGEQVYTPADFARFAPRTAMDMLNQVPGFTVRLPSDARGLGVASENVLLNGERVASKSGGAVEELQKLSADQVERIEIVNGALLDIPGLSGQVANVVTKAQRRNSGQFAWQPDFRPQIEEPFLLRGEVSYSGTSGTLGYTLGLEVEGGRYGTDGQATLTDRSGAPFEFREDSLRTLDRNPEGSARLTWTGPNSTIANLGAEFEVERYRSWETSVRQRTDGSDSVRSIAFRENGWELALNGDIALDMAGGRLKLIGLTEIANEPSENSSITIPADGSQRAGDRVISEDRTREYIARAEYGWSPGKADLQISAEAAFNSLTSDSRRFALDPSNLFREVPFSAGSGTVHEDRYELMGTYGRPLSTALSMQLLAGAEHSTLAAGGVSRSFFRPKGSLSLAWKPSPNSDVSLKLARVVGQLNFNDFLASVNLSENTENAGNVNLVPPQSWEADLEVSRNLGAWGKTRLRLYARRISDIVDTVPIGINGESLGNIDRATRAGLEWDSTFQFDPIGWRGAKLDATLRLQESSVRDPLTGEKRAISFDMRSEINLNLRHDVPGTAWAWGAGLFRYRGSTGYRLTQVSRGWDTPFHLSAFVEHKDLFGLTVGAAIGNIIDQRLRFERTVFDGRRTDPIRFLESRSRQEGPVLTFTVRGNF